MRVILIIIVAQGTVNNGLVQGREDLEMRGEVEIIQIDSMITIDHNTKNSPEDLRRLATIKTSVKKHQPTPV